MVQQVSAIFALSPRQRKNEFLISSKFVIFCRDHNRSKRFMRWAALWNIIKPCCFSVCLSPDETSTLNLQCIRQRAPMLVMMQQSLARDGDFSSRVSTPVGWDALVLIFWLWRYLSTGSQPPRDTFYTCHLKGLMVSTVNAGIERRFLTNRYKAAQLLNPSVVDCNFMAGWCISSCAGIFYCQIK